MGKAMMPDHDTCCPPGLKYDDPGTCWVCIGLSKARHEERAQISDALFAMAERIMP
jgi:hypothetical protein